MYDIAVVGLGPAGAALCRLLPENIKCIAIDKKHTSEASGFSKVCGGLLAPDAQKFLSGMDLTLPKSVLVDPQIFSVRTIDVKAKLTRHYQRFYINMDRHKFDQWLCSLIPKHVKVIGSAKCDSIERQDDGFKITYQTGGKKETVSAKYIVGADGAASIVRNTFFKSFNTRKYVAIQQWFVENETSPSYCCVFDPEITDCYAWGLSKDNSYIFGGAFPFENARERFNKLKLKMKDYGVSLENPQKTEACIILRPRGPFDFCTGSDGVFLIGEAAGFISPSSLEGISYAFRSAYALYNVLKTGCEKPEYKYKKATRRIRLSLTLKCLKSPFMYNPFLRKLVMKAGIGSISIISRKT